MRKTAVHFLVILLMLSMLLMLPLSALADPCPYSADGGHHYALVSETPATCTTEGAKVYTCTNMGESGMPCGASYTETIPATGHQWDSGSMTQAPTCTTDGVMTYTCTGRNLKGAACGATKTEAIPATGHSPRTESGKAATCTEDGYTEVSVCGICGEVLKARESIPALGHAWDSGTATQAATCTSDGVKTIKCTRCGVTRTEAIPATGHSPVTVPGKAATCTEAGLTDGSKCSACGTTLTAQQGISALGHSWDGGQVTKEATVETEGVKTYTCTRCGATKTEAIPKLPPPSSPPEPAAPAHVHQWSDWKVDGSVHASCVQREMQYRTCTGCSETEYRYGNYGDHDWGEWEVVTPAASGVAGQEKRVCKIDASHVETREIPALAAEETKPEETKEDNLHPSVSLHIWADPDAGVGKRYKGAIVSIHLQYTNTGDCPVYIPWLSDIAPDNYHDESASNGRITATEEFRYYYWYGLAPLNPGDTYTLINDNKMWGYHVSDGYVHWVLHMAAWYVDTDGEYVIIGADSNELIVDLTYPDSMDPEADQSLKLVKGIAHGPENESWFQAGEEIPWTLTVTNTSEAPVKNVIVTDEGVTVGTFAEIVPAETVTCSLPAHVVTEYEAEVAGSVSNVASATGEDKNGYPHSWVSNSISVPTSEWSPVPLPGTTPEEIIPGGGFDPWDLPGITPWLSPVPGPDGMPILGPDGTPIYAPIGTVPVIGPDGKPLVTPEGWPVLMLPDGTYVAVTPDGPILCDKDGNPILDPWGNYIFIIFDEDTLYCNLKLDALGDYEMDHTLHACSSHILPTLQALAAEPAEAVAIWQEEIGRMYDLLWEAGNDLGKTAVEKDRTAFNSYMAAYRVLYGDEAAAEMLRLWCTEICCMIHTAPDELPDSLLGDYATLMSVITYDTCERVYGEVFGGDCDLDVHLNTAMSDTLRKARETMFGGRDDSFTTALAYWQMALDCRLNDTYKAAGRDMRTAIAAWRQSLDQMCAARKELLIRLYPENDSTVRERLMNLYRDAAIEAYIGK